VGDAAGDIPNDFPCELREQERRDQRHTGETEGQSPLRLAWLRRSAAEASIDIHDAYN
jgi:hypothetical protein